MSQSPSPHDFYLRYATQGAEKVGLLAEPALGVDILCKVEAFFSLGGGDRLYEVRRDPSRRYFSMVSGGQIHWVPATATCGRNGEPLEDVRYEWIITEGNGFIGRFCTWEDVLVFLFWQMRAVVASIETK